MYAVCSRLDWRRRLTTGRSHRHRIQLTVESLECRTLLSFYAPANFTTGVYVWSLAVADLNGDGTPDLITGSAPGTVSVLLGNGDGSFQPPQNYDTGSEFVTSVAVADVNGDGVPDLITANAGSQPTDQGSLTLLLGNGDGTFQAPQTILSGNSPAHVAVLGLVGGQLEIVVGFDGNNPTDEGSVAVLQLHADGTYQTVWTHDIGADTSPIPVVGDLNGDGIPDLAVLSNLGRVEVFLGNGDGTFQDPQSYAVGSDPTAIASGDVNGDGIPDLVVTNTAQGTGTPSVSVLLGNGDGSFQRARTTNAGPTPVGLALGDVNGDGQLDVVVANNQPGTVSVLLGNGDGTFQLPQTVDVGASPQQVAVADVNGDGQLDLVSADFSGAVSVRLNNGDGTFPTLPKFDTGLAAINGNLVAGDFNGDGIPDLAVTNGVDTVSVLLGNGDGTFQPPIFSSFATQNPVISSVAVSDLNGDGQLDLILVSNAFPRVSGGGVTVLLGNGDGTFRPGFFQAGILTGGLVPQMRTVAVGDFNGDGIPDLVVSNLDDSDSVSVLLGNGDGSFQAPHDYPLGGTPSRVAVAVADLNQDGQADIVTANTTLQGLPQGSVSVLFGNGDGTFQDPQNFTVDQLPSTLAVADLNGDGIPDLILNNNLGGPNGGGLSVLLGNGDGTFQAAGVYLTGVFAFSMAVADFNQDNIPDLAVGFSGPGGDLGVGVLLGNGDGSFQSTNVIYGSAAYVGAVADFNGDGFPDVATVNFTGQAPTISILANAADWPADPRGRTVGSHATSGHRTLPHGSGSGLGSALAPITCPAQTTAEPGSLHRSAAAPIHFPTLPEESHCPAPSSSGLLTRTLRHDRVGLVLWPELLDYEG